MDGEAALDIVEDAEVLARLLDRHDVHEAEGEGVVGADLAVDLDQALLDDGRDLAAGEGELQAVAQEDRHREALAELVGSGRGAGGLEGGTKQKGG